MITTSEPDKGGHFGPYGGRYVPEVLMAPLEELEKAYEAAKQDPAFHAELAGLMHNYAGRPTALWEAKRLSSVLGGARIFIKREDLLHTGAHKINNCLGQILLARRMGKKRVIAETGAGQHGVATATACALLDLPCEVFMGAVDVERQAPNVARMKLLGAKVTPVESGSRTLKDAMNEALRDWVTNVRTTAYCVGSAAGPHPYPTLVADFQRVIGDEARTEILARTTKLPDAVVACVGGGSNAIGMFRAFVGDADVALYGVEAAGEGLGTHLHAATLTKGRVGVLHGAKSYVLADEDGQIVEAHSVSAGLDYPGVGPEHAHLKDTGRVTYLTCTDAEAVRAVEVVARTTGILIALETAHAFARIADVGKAEAKKRGRAATIAVSLSGRGDKDLASIERWRSEHGSR